MKLLNLFIKSDYKYSYTKQVQSRKLKNIKDVRIFGMGGSSLGANAIYDFLRYKIKKIFIFYQI